MIHALLLVISPMALMLAAMAVFRPQAWLAKPAGLMTEVAALIALAGAAISALALAVWGPANSPTLGAAGLGLSVRLDVVSVTMLLLVSFVGWIVLRFARTYLRGEPGRGRFLGWIAVTLSSVMLFVQAGNVVLLFAAWIATSLVLHRLLLFYPHRPAAQRAARKKFVFARIGDAALLTALGLLVAVYGTGDIAQILSLATSGSGPLVGAAAFLLAIAGLLKSAQFPSHGWLTEMMEAPTPVSALLHAGVINAGGFLLIRFADVILLSHGALATLLLIGGFTAIFGSLVMLAQPMVKTSLAWSTVAQMGFMMLQCGLGLFSLALLHIVAHSLYKAHAFLVSGTAVEAVARIKRPGPIAIPGAGAVGRAFAAAIAIYLLIGGTWGTVFGIESKSPQAIAIGGILIFGVAYLIAQGLADAAPRALALRTSAAAVAISVSYFALHSASEWLTAGTLPAAPVPGPLEWFLMILALISFGTVAVVQATFPLWAHHPAAAVFRVHLANGLYVNAIIDRLLGIWTPSGGPSRRGAAEGAKP